MDLSHMLLPCVTSLRDLEADQVIHRNCCYCIYIYFIYLFIYYLFIIFFFLFFFFIIYLFVKSH